MLLDITKETSKSEEEINSLSQALLASAITGNWSSISDIDTIQQSDLGKL